MLIAPYKDLNMAALYSSYAEGIAAFTASGRRTLLSLLGVRSHSGSTLYWRGDGVAVRAVLLRADVAFERIAALAVGNKAVTVIIHGIADMLRLTRLVPPV